MHATTLTSDQDVEKLYDSIRRGKVKLVGLDGEVRILPDSLHSFLITIADLMSQGKCVYLVSCPK